MRKQSKRNPANRNQANAAKADADWRNGQRAEGKQSAVSTKSAEGDPGFHRSSQQIKPVAEPDVDKRQAQEAQPAAIFP